MSSRRVLLLRMPSLLSEGVERLLRQLEEVELIGPWDLNLQSIARLAQAVPDIVVIAGEGPKADGIGALINRLLEQHPNLPIVRIGMEQSTIRLYTSRALPARTSELVDLIRSLPLQHLEEAEPRT